MLDFKKKENSPKKTYLLVCIPQLVLEDGLPVRQVLHLVRERVEGLNQLPDQLGVHFHGGHLEKARGRTLVLQAREKCLVWLGSLGRQATMLSPCAGWCLEGKKVGRSISVLKFIKLLIKPLSRCRSRWVPGLVRPGP